MAMKKPKNSLKEQTKETGKKSYKKIKKTINKGKEKVDQARQSSLWQKTKRVAKKATRITGSHLATFRASITLSNNESELMEELKNKLNKKGIYPSKSEILRAGLWNLRKMKGEELENALKELFKIKKTRIL